MSSRIRRFDLNGGIDQIKRPASIAKLINGQTAIVKRVRMVRLFGQELLIKRKRLTDASCLM